jgi:hydrocephalus-inducing protein
MGRSVTGATAAAAMQVTMSGEANNIKYTIEPQLFDVGIQLFDRSVDRELLIHNQGKVPFSYSINLLLLSLPGIVEAHPTSGRIAAGARESIKLKV